MLKLNGNCFFEDEDERRSGKYEAQARKSLSYCC